MEEETNKEMDEVCSGLCLIKAPYHKKLKSSSPHPNDGLSQSNLLDSTYLLLTFRVSVSSVKPSVGTFERKGRSLTLGTADVTRWFFASLRSIYTPLFICKIVKVG